MLAAKIANSAARMVVEEGLEYGPAKRRAIRQLGLSPRTALPDNRQVEEAVKEYIALFCSETQPFELRALRELALPWMERLASFRPYLSGAVWHGCATKHSDIYIQLFCDDSKSAEIYLINQRVSYTAQTIQGFQKNTVEALSVASWSATLQKMVALHLLIYDLDDLRGALRKDAKGRVPRGSLAAVQNLLLEFR